MLFVATWGMVEEVLCCSGKLEEFGSSLVGLGETQVVEGLENSERGDVACENLVAPLVNKSRFVKQVIK